MIDLLIVGYSTEYHIGAHLYDAAKQLNLMVKLLDASNAHAGGFVARQINWRLRQHRPANLDKFSKTVVSICKELMPKYMLVTGITAPNYTALIKISSMGTKIINYLTDDPWNPVHHAPWFIKALPYYDKVYSPRRSNLEDLSKLGCQAEYLPFAYSPKYHYRELTPSSGSHYSQCDILFYGGADRDRIPYIETLQQAGQAVHVYGGYWLRNPKTRSIARGIANPEILRLAVSGAKMTLCLVRRSNRDGHSMRSYEAPAMGGCLLMEDTDDHRELFGDDLQAVAYFKSHSELEAKAHLLRSDGELREKLRNTACYSVTHRPNTYMDRLRHMVLEGA